MTAAPPRTAVIINATRPSRPEAIHAGAPVIDAVFANVVSWGLEDSTIIVVDHQTEALLDTMKVGQATVVVDEDGAGRSSGLSVALDAAAVLMPDAAAALVVDCDVPRIPAATVPALMEAMADGHAMAAAPTYRYVRGGPVLLARRLWDRVKALDTDQRLEDLLAAHPEWTTVVVISEPVPESVG